jgi:hypothetical protein
MARIYVVRAPETIWFVFSTRSRLTIFPWSTPIFFTTLVNILVSGMEYAVSFDFEMSLIGNLVGFAPLDIQGEIMVGLARKTGHPYTFSISRPFSIGIEATLGNPQIFEHETFVPLVVKKVFEAAK